MLLCACRQNSTFSRLSRFCVRAVASKSSLLSGSAVEGSNPEDTLEKAAARDKRFIDKVRVLATGGHGGAGCESYIKRSRKGTFRPIPDGGHGGQGGDVIVEACLSVRDLQDVNFPQRAGPGGPGKSQRKTGVRGQNRIIKVPVGTCISPLLELDAEQPRVALSSCEAGEEQPVDRDTHDRARADLHAPGASAVVARGGVGGRGSVSKGRGAGDLRLDADQGQPGEEVLLSLELKLLADFGFVGAPNVGKSTLLKALTNAKPKIANYPFTTLQPQLGIMEIDQKQVVLADIPGLIAGASQNRGRGFAFLRHVERTRMLAYVLDLSSGADSSDGCSQLQQLSDLQAEVQHYSSELSQKEALIVGNKVDLLEADSSRRLLVELKAATGMSVHLVSAKHGHGMDSLRKALSSSLASDDTDNKVQTGLESSLQ